MKIETSRIYNMDCLEGMKQIPDGAIDLCVTDPPYELETSGGGIFDARDAYKAYGGHNPRKIMKNIANITDGFDEMILNEVCRVLRKINIYLWCSQKQIPKYIDYFVKDRGCNWDLLTWHKTNPVPACGNKYLSDTEYLLFFRERGVPLFGTFFTKKKYWLQKSNTDENKKYGHPTVKPINMIETLIINSSKEGQIILDPFMGSGTTAVAAMRKNRYFIGFEIDKGYYEKSLKRIEEEEKQLNIERI